jgi:hypothetical protein
MRIHLNKAIRQALGLGLLTCSMAPAQAQFWYVGIGVQFPTMLLSSVDDEGSLITRNGYSGISAAPYVGYRPGRRVCIGVSANLILLASKKEYYDEIKGTFEDGAGFTTWSAYDQDAGRIPYLFEASVRPGNNYNLHGAFIIGERTGFFVEGRLVFGGLREELRVKRSAMQSVHGNVSAISEKVLERKSGVYPGIGVGFMPHWGDRVFARMHMGIDFNRYTRGGLAYELESQRNNGPLQPVTFSLAEQRGFTYCTDLTIGARF